MDGLVRSGLELGVATFELRQVFYHPESTIVDHSRMPSLLVRDDEFLAMATQIQSEYGKFARFHINRARASTERAAQVTAASLLPLRYKASAPGIGG
jgi:hypothetical protein